MPAPGVRIASPTGIGSLLSGAPAPAAGASAVMCSQSKSRSPVRSCGSWTPASCAPVSVDRCDELLPASRAPDRKVLRPGLPGDALELFVASRADDPPVFRWYQYSRFHPISQAFLNNNMNSKAEKIIKKVQHFLRFRGVLFRRITGETARYLTNSKAAHSVRFASWT